MEVLFKNEIFEKSISDFPQTRYQGSKYKLLPWIWESISFLDFHTAADLFGGTASVSYLLKVMGKSVTYNDILKSNYLTGLALIENKNTKIEDFELEALLNDTKNNKFQFIYENFKDIYYTDEENKWLDRIIQNIYNYQGVKVKKALLFWALFQACIIKRPYNLFHRKNLYIRTSNVKRSFGNKTTWDKSFEYYFKKFVHEANNAVFDNGQKCIAQQCDALQIKNNFELVYIDTPYISSKGVGINYFQFYHFLEGICDYYNWKDKIDFSKKHKPLKNNYNPWNDKSKIKEAFFNLISHHRKSHIVISYRSDGIPSIEELQKIVSDFKKKIKIVTYQKYKYVLSTNHNSHEVLIIGWD